MKGQDRWVLLVPFVCFAIATQLFVFSENEARVLFSRAQEQWRQQNYEAAVSQFEEVRKKHSKSKFAVDALWEIATIRYFNQYDISSALHFFEKLASDYPDNERAVDAHLKAAEIYEVELNEISNAMRHWQEALDKNIGDALRREVSFKLAEACFKTHDFKDALRRYNLVAADGQDHHLKDQSYIRIGSIFQLQGEHDKAIRAFANVLENTDCQHCRLQGQLGLIESYEHLDRLPEAIEIAERINEAEYPAAMREELLGRLTEKRKYYEPSLRQ